MQTRNPPVSSSSLTLVEFTGVVDRHQNALCAFLHHLVGDIEQAYDLLQDTLHDAWRAAREGVAPFVAESDDDQMRRWLFSVAYHKGLSVLRRRLIRWESLDFLIRFANQAEMAPRSRTSLPKVRHCARPWPGSRRSIEPASYCAQRMDSALPKWGRSSAPHQKSSESVCRAPGSACARSTSRKIRALRSQTNEQPPYTNTRPDHPLQGFCSAPAPPR